MHLSCICANNLLTKSLSRKPIKAPNGVFSLYKSAGLLYWVRQLKCNSMNQKKNSNFCDNESRILETAKPSNQYSDSSKEMLRPYGYKNLSPNLQQLLPKLAYKHLH
jgi:hypothetical protein